MRLEFYSHPPRIKFLKPLRIPECKTGSIDMHGFSAATALDALKGAEMTQICIGSNEIILTFFPDETYIRVTSIESFYSKNAKELRSIYTAKGPLPNLLGSRVVSVEVLNEHEASLLLDSGTSLILTDDSRQFESVLFCIKGKTIVV